MDDEMLDQLERGAFAYFLDAANPDNGLVADTSRTGSRSPPIRWRWSAAG